MYLCFFSGRTAGIHVSIRRTCSVPVEKLISCHLSHRSSPSPIPVASASVKRASHLCPWMEVRSCCTCSTVKGCISKRSFRGASFTCAHYRQQRYIVSGREWPPGSLWVRLSVNAWGLSFAFALLSILPHFYQLLNSHPIAHMTDTRTLVDSGP